MSSQDLNDFKFNDYLGSYVTDTTAECFDYCIKDFSEPQYSDSEKKCILSCFSKFYYSFIKTGEIIQSSKDEL